MFAYALCFQGLHSPLTTRTHTWVWVCGRRSTFQDYQAKTPGWKYRSLKLPKNTDIFAQVLSGDACVQISKSPPEIYVMHHARTLSLPLRFSCISVNFLHIVITLTILYVFPYFLQKCSTLSACRRTSHVYFLHMLATLSPCHRTSQITTTLTTAFYFRPFLFADAFNLVGLSPYIPYYEYALDLITDREAEEDLTVEQRDIIEADADNLYGLIHARYILTNRGLQKMVRGPLHFF